MDHERPAVKEYSILLPAGLILINSLPHEISFGILFLFCPVAGYDKTICYHKSNKDFELFPVIAIFAVSDTKGVPQDIEVSGWDALCF